MSRKTKTHKILIIDDEAAILSALELFLEQEGYEAEVSTSFEKYLKSSKRPRLPDLIILDILLGNEDGRAIARRFKASTVTQRIPIIMISAHPDIAEMSRSAGADAYLPKPFNTEVILQTIDRLLEAAPSSSLS
ncbi:MAG: response regulator [Candidatus Saccharimonadales bacterium]